MGGMIAQIAASEHPGRVLSLTSIMSSTGNPNLPSAAPDVMAMLTRRAPNPREDEAGYLEHGVAFARRIAGPRFPLDTEAYKALLREETRRAYDPAGFARQIAAIAVTGDRRSRLAGIAVPTLVVHGADDPLIPSACGADTASSIPHAEFMRIEGMGHDLPPELYQAVADGIARIVRSAAATRRR
jgi:pimeloyl-ACP methyl ester carboxylesterase